MCFVSAAVCTAARQHSCKAIELGMDCKCPVDVYETEIGTDCQRTLDARQGL